MKRDEMGLILEAMLNEQKPMKFNPHEAGNVILQGESNFEQVCITLTENGMHRVKEMTEFEFYSTLQYFQKRYEKQQ